MNYTLQLFKLLLDKSPIGLLQEMLDKGREANQQLEEDNVDDKQIEEAMITYGKQSWSYMQAEKELLESEGMEIHEQFFNASLSDELAAKWKEYIKGGGNIHDYRHGQEFEEYFTAEENTELERAMIEADGKTKEKFAELVESDKKEAYDELLQKYEQEKEQIIAKLKELEGLKDSTEKWDDEIDAEIYYFEKGFAGLETSPTVAAVQEKIDWYQGQIEVGNK